jgi:hypothetical protein
MDRIYFMVDDEEWKRPKGPSQPPQSLLALARGAWIRKYRNNLNFTGKKCTKTSNKYKIKTLQSLRFYWLGWAARVMLIGFRNVKRPRPLLE